MLFRSKLRKEINMKQSREKRISNALDLMREFIASGDAHLAAEYARLVYSLTFTGRAPRYI